MRGTYGFKYIVYTQSVLRCTYEHLENAGVILRSRNSDIAFSYKRIIFFLPKRAVIKYVRGSGVFGGWVGGGEGAMKIFGGRTPLKEWGC